MVDIQSKNVSVELTVKEVDAILLYLSKGQWDVVDPIIRKVREQVIPQAKSLQEEASIVKE